LDGTSLQAGNILLEGAELRLLRKRVRTVLDVDVQILRSLLDISSRHLWAVSIIFEALYTYVLV